MRPLSWQQPPWVRPQPAPFHNKGWGVRRTHSQAGLTQGRGMWEEGTAAQVAPLSEPSQPACAFLLPSSGGPYQPGYNAGCPEYPTSIPQHSGQT